MRQLEIVSLLILSTVCVCEEDWTFQMYKDTLLNEYDCNNGEYAFSLLETMSAIACAHHCGLDVTCKSIFYVPGATSGSTSVSTSGSTSGTCNGCAARYKSTDIATLNLNSLNGSVYYASTFDFVWGDSGYIFIDTKQIFSSGTTMCNVLGGYPVAIETEDEHNFLKSRLVELNVVGPIYIGLHQPDGVGTDWIWQGTGQVMTYNGFRTGEPDKAGELCVAASDIYSETLYEWADLYCSRKQFILCEMNI